MQRISKYASHRRIGAMFFPTSDGSNTQRTVWLGWRWHWWVWLRQSSLCGFTTSSVASWSVCKLPYFDHMGLIICTYKTRIIYNMDPMNFNIQEVNLWLQYSLTWDLCVCVCVWQTTYIYFLMVLETRTQRSRFCFFWGYPLHWLADDFLLI